MRKIEKQMNDAISNLKDGEQWKNANTVVRNLGDVTEVLLHGNKIAELGDFHITLFDGGWQSNTTKSRLNALLRAHGIGNECVFQKNYVWNFRMSDGTTIPFFSGMRLN
jgi:hypothetical protein